MNRKVISLVIGVVIIAVLAYYANYTLKSSKASDDLNLIEFAVLDTASVNKIEIFDSFTGESFTVKRSKEGKWVDENDNCVKQEIPKTMLETFMKVTLKGYVPENAMENMKKQMMSKHKKVTIYQDGQWTKTWFVGHSTSDHYGTHMLLETPKIKSDNPVIMGMKGFYGILEPRFVADAKAYECSALFSFKREEIKEVIVENNVFPVESFEITQTSKGSSVTSNGQPIENVNHDNLLFYLNGFKNIHFNRPNYAYSEQQIDSVRSLKPDYRLIIKGKEDEFEMDFYRRPDPEESTKDSIVWDADYFWGVKSDGQLVRMQYFVVGPLLFGQDVFVNKTVNN